MGFEAVPSRFGPTPTNQRGEVFMVRHIAITSALLVIAALALSATEESAASAATACYRTMTPKQGDYTKPNCEASSKTTKALEGEYVLGEALKKLEANLWCAKEPNKEANFKNNTCTENEKESKAEFISVLWFPGMSLTLAGSAYPLHLNYESSTVQTSLGDGNGTILEGEGLKVLHLIGEAQAELGTARVDFGHITEGSSGKKCHTSGDTTATVLTEGSFRLVITSLYPNLQIGELYSPNEAKIECEGLNLRVRGTIISSTNTNGITETTELTNVKGLLAKGSTAGSQEITEYYSSEGTKVKAGLIVELGSVEHSSNLQVKEEVTMTALSPNMFVITDW
jgi:hypothetical protein